MLVQLFAERLLLRIVDPGKHPVQGLLRRADRSHSMMDPSGAEAPLDDLETAAFAEDDVRGWYAHVFELDLRMAVRCVIVAIYVKNSFDGHTRGAGRDEDHGLLLVDVLMAGTRLAHRDVYLTSRVAGAATPPFLWLA